MPFPVPYTSPGYTQIESVNKNIAQSVVIPVVTVTLPAPNSLIHIEPTPILVAPIVPTTSVIQPFTGVVVAPTVLNIVKNQVVLGAVPDINDYLIRSPNFALNTRTGGGSGGSVSSIGLPGTIQLSNGTGGFTGVSEVFYCSTSQLLGTPFLYSPGISTSGLVTEVIITNPDMGFLVSSIKSKPFSDNVSTLAYDPATAEIYYTQGVTGLSTFNQLYTSSLSVSSIVFSRSTISIGQGAGINSVSSLTGCSVAIGAEAGTIQATESVAVGAWAGRYRQNTQSIAVGALAGMSSQGGGCIAIGYNAGQLAQGGGVGLYSESIAIGVNAGSNSQGQWAIAIGKNAGGTNQGGNSIAIGREAGSGGGGLIGAQGIAIGYNTGVDSDAIAIGTNNLAGQRSVSIGSSIFQGGKKYESISVGSDIYTGVNSITIGTQSYNIGEYGIAIGNSTIVSTTGIGIGQKVYSVGGDSIAIGRSVGAGIGCISIGGGSGAVRRSGAENSYFIGGQAGFDSAGTNCLGFGQGVGFSTMGNNSLAIGNKAGTNCMGVSTIAIGDRAGMNNIGDNSIAFGNGAGFSTMGSGSIAIGSGAGYENQAISTIIINATGNKLSGVLGQKESLYIAPIRNVPVISTLSTLVYNPLTKEVCYTTAGGGGLAGVGGVEGSIQYNSTSALYGTTTFKYDNLKNRMEVPRLAVLGATTTLGVTSYTDTQLNTNLYLGDPTLYTNFPDMTLYPATAIIGTLANPATTISMASAGNINLTAGTGVSISGGGITILGAFGITATGGTINLGAGAISMLGGAITIGAGTITFTGGGIIMGAGYITMASGALSLTSGAIVIGSGAILMGTLGALDGAGILSYGGDLSFHKGLLNTGGSGFFDVSVQTESTITSTIAINKTATLGNFLDATSKVNTMTIYGTHETYGSGLYLSNVSGNSRGAGLFGNYITSLDDATNTLHINNVSVLENTANNMAIIGLSTINGLPFDGGLFSTIKTQALFTSSIQASTITVGEPTDTIYAGAKIIVYGANNGAKGGIYLSSVGANGIGAGLYTNTIAPALGTGTLLSITGVSNLDNSNYSMTMFGLSTVNGMPHNPQLNSVFSTIQSSNLSSIQASIPFIHGSTLQASTIQMATDGKITTNFLYCSSISTQSIQSYSQSEFYSLYLPSSGVVTSYNIPSGSAVIGGGMYLGNPPSFTTPASGSLTMTGNLDTTAVGSQIRAGGQGITVADGGKVVLTQQGGNGGVYVSSILGTAYMNSGNIYANVGNVSSLSVSSIATTGLKVSGIAPQGSIFSTLSYNPTTTEIKYDKPEFPLLYASTIVASTIQMATDGKITTAGLVSNYLQTNLVSSGTIVNSGFSYLGAGFWTGVPPFPGGGSIASGSASISGGLSVGVYPPVAPPAGGLTMTGILDLTSASASAKLGLGGMLISANGGLMVDGILGGIIVSSVNGITQINPGIIYANTTTISSMNVSSITTPGSLFVSPIRNAVPSGLSTLYYNGNTKEITAGSSTLPGSGYYGAWYSSATQTTTAGTDTIVTFNNTYGTPSGISKSSGNVFTFANAGTYNFTFNAQINASAGTDTVSVWLTNTSALASTTFSIVLANNDLKANSKTYQFTFSAGDTLTVHWTNATGKATLSALTSSGVVPASASCSLILNQVALALAGTTPTGITGSVQYKDSGGLFAGDNEFNYNTISSMLAVPVLYTSSINASTLTCSKISYLTSNVALGQYATSGNGGVSVGGYAGSNILGGNNNICIGNNAYATVTGTYNSTIILNATNNSLGISKSGVYITSLNPKPTSGIIPSTFMYYDAGTSEVTYSEPTFVGLAVSTLYTSSISVAPQGYMTVGGSGYISVQSGGYITAPYISSLSLSTSYGSISSLNVSSLDCGNFSTSFGSISSLNVSSINGIAPVGSPAFYFANSNFTGGSPLSAPAIGNTFGAFLTQNINLTTASSYVVNATATVYSNGSASNIYAGIFVNSVFYGASTIVTDTTLGIPNQQGFMTLSVNYADTFAGSGSQTVDLQLYTDATNTGDYTFLNGAMNIITGLSVGT
jgi:hypothetical protein